MGDWVDELVSTAKIRVYPYAPTAMYPDCRYVIKAIVYPKNAEKGCYASTIITKDEMVKNGALDGSWEATRDMLVEAKKPMLLVKLANYLREHL